jgi:hypothetical protein
MSVRIAYFLCRIATIFSALVTVPVVALSAQTSVPIALPRLTAPITLDGKPDEAAWQQIPPLPLTLYAPVFRGTPKQRTEIRVAYDDEYFYAAGWFYDSESNGIRVNSLYRDRWNGDDAFAIYIDAFNDKRNAKWFGTTPGGIRFDQLVSDDGSTLNESWDTFWTSKTTVTRDGWFAEVRIPFSSIGFRPDAEGRAVMGLTVTRLVSRTGERVTFPEIDPKFEFRRPSLAQTVALHDVRSHKPIYVTPYALTGSNQRAKGTLASGFETERGTSREMGLDVRYPLSGRLTLDVTVNTDFAQVEADEQQINLDRFPLFYPERRRFFQEGSGVFDFTTGSSTQLFNSRRIGLTAGALPVPVVGGARLVGRAGAWDVGLLEMQTEDVKAEGVPSENFGVLRLRRPVINQHSTVGLMTTVYQGGGRHNYGLGTDAVVRVHGDQYLTAKWTGSIDDRDTAGVSLTDRSHFFAQWERRTGRGLQFNANVVRSGDMYRPELAFMQRRNYTSANVASNYFIFTDKHPVFRRVYPGWLAFQTWRNTDHALESAQWAVWVQWDTKTGGGGWIEPKVFHENVLSGFAIDRNLTVPAGPYTYGDLQLALSMNSGAKLRTSLDARAGTYFDGRRAQAILRPTWNVNPHLELGGDYQITRLSFPTRDQGATLHRTGVRVRAALDARSSGNALVQYSSTSDRLDFNVRLRYAFAEGTDLWVVYNEGLDTYTERLQQPLVGREPFSMARALIVKYTHTVGF